MDKTIFKYSNNNKCMVGKIIDDQFNIKMNSFEFKTDIENLELFIILIDLIIQDIDNNNINKERIFRGVDYDIKFIIDSNNLYLRIFKENNRMTLCIGDRINKILGKLKNKLINIINNKSCEIYNKAYVFRINPTKDQRILINKSIGCSRFVYNHFLDKAKKDGYDSYNKYSEQLTRLKNKLEWLKEPDKYALQNSLKDLDDSFKRFFKKQNGFPKFKSKKFSKGSYRTQYSRGSSGVGNIEIEDNYIKLPKLGWVKFRKSRKVKGDIKNVTIRKSKVDKYYISITVEERIYKKPLTNKEIGVDLGLKNFLVTSNGTKISNPRILDKYEKKLSRLQRNLSRKKKGSNNWEKARKRVAKLHEKISNVRKDFLHKLSTKLIRENQTIVVETLKVKNMLRDSRLAKNISDVSWSKFVEFLEYKAEWYGKELIKIDTYFPSSQLCSNCGYQNEEVKDLKVRKWECPQCNEIHDRDINASKNILKEGLRVAN